jgi:mannosyltransferase OCH1-like enzyme
MIPKIIMQTWKTQNVPAIWEKSPVSILEHMPDWNYILLDDISNRSFIGKNFPDFLSTYDNFEYPIQRADAIRYCWLYLNGGLYLDLDIELIGSIEHLFDLSSSTNDNLFFVNSANVGSSLTNSLMASSAFHPIWLDMIEEMKQPLPWWAVGRHLKVIWSTGPGMVNRVVKRGKYSWNMLPSRVVNPQSICEIYGECPSIPDDNSDALIKSLPGQSWTTWDTSFYGQCYCHMERTIAIGLLIIVLVVMIIWFLFR